MSVELAKELLTPYGYETLLERCAADNREPTEPEVRMIATFEQRAAARTASCVEAMTS